MSQLPRKPSTGQHESFRVEHVVGDYLNGFRLVPHAVSRTGAIVTFGGSEGSPAFERASALAQEGFEVYALYFFGQENQRPDLQKVPVEFFAELIDRLQGLAAAGPLTVIGGSKGAELALLLASVYERIDNLVLFAPTAHVFQGLGNRSTEASSWTLNGRDVPFIGFRYAGVGALFRILAAMALRRPLSHRHGYEKARERAPADVVSAARLDPNAVAGHVLVFAGSDDRMWPADDAAREIHALRPDAQVHIYPGAGHVFSEGPVAAGLALGGTAGVNHAAERESTRVLMVSLRSWHPAVSRS